MVRPLVPAVAALAATLALAACNQGSAPTTEQANATASEASVAANQAESAASYGDKIRALPEGQRNGVFLRAIRDGKQDCQEITGQYEAAAIDGKPTWVVTCDKTHPWIVSVGADGIAIVTEMSQASRLPPKAS